MTGGDNGVLVLVFGLLHLQGLPVCGMTDTVVLDRRNSRTFFSHVVSVIVQSEEYYKQRVHQKVQIMPLDKDSHLLIQFNYLDIEKRHPCRDWLAIYEMDKKTNRFQSMMPNSCGTMRDLFRHHEYEYGELGPYLTTHGKGNGVMIEWMTKHPTGQHRGFHVTISAFKLHIRYGISKDGSMMFRCNDGRHIPMKLQCDNVTNCADWSDETNCTLPMLPPYDSGPGLKQKVRCVGLFGGHCSLYKYWLSWTLPLIAILTLALIALKGNRLRQRRRMIRQLRLGGNIRLA